MGLQDFANLYELLPGLGRNINLASFHIFGVYFSIEITLFAKWTVSRYSREIRLTFFPYLFGVTFSYVRMCAAYEKTCLCVSDVSTDERTQR